VARERGARTYVLVFDREDDLIAELAAFVRAERIGSGRLAGVGGFSKATLGYFDRERKAYQSHPIDEQVEVLSLLGTVSVMDGQPHAHMHASVGLRDTSVRGGHVQAATIWPTLELFVSEYSGELHRAMVPEVGAALIDLS
jgi:hypothetical protein